MAAKTKSEPQTSVRTTDFNITFTWDTPVAEMTSITLAFRRGPLRGLVLSGAFEVAEMSSGTYWLNRHHEMLQRPWPRTSNGQPDMTWLREAFAKAQRKAGRVDYKGKARWVRTGS